MLVASPKRRALHLHLRWESTPRGRDMLRHATLPLFVLALLAPTAADAMCRWTVTGQVVDPAGRPIVGLAIDVEGRRAGTDRRWRGSRFGGGSTDGDGRFSIRSKRMQNRRCREARHIRVSTTAHGRSIILAVQTEAGGNANFGPITYDAPAGPRPDCSVPVGLRFTIGGQAYPDVRVRLVAEAPRPAELRTWDFRAAFDAVTDDEGRVSGTLRDCGQVGSRVLVWRSDFHSGATPLHPERESFGRPGQERHIGAPEPPEFHAPTGPPPDELRFRLPVETPNVLGRNLTGGFPLGPARPGLDHGPWNQLRRHMDRSRSAFCTDYRGQRLLPHCYHGHRGVDFILAGGFAAMDGWPDHPGRRADPNHVVAAARGTIIRYIDGHFDRCSVASPGRTRCNRETANRVYIRHEGDVFTKYLHFKQGSVNAALAELARQAGQPFTPSDGNVVDTDIQVYCGDIIGQVGSSGNSSLPHLHFEVQYRRQLVDPFAGRLSSHSWWRDQDGPHGLPAATCDEAHVRPPTPPPAQENPAAPPAAPPEPPPPPEPPRAPIVPADAIACAVDQGTRDLPMSIPGGAHSPDGCRQTCGRRGHAYAGLQYGGQCFCGDAFGAYGRRPMSECLMPCQADPALACGNGWRNMVLPTGVRPPPPGGPVGCFRDAPDRDLPVGLDGGRFTEGRCRRACRQRGHRFAALQYGGQCFCGDTYGRYGRAPDNECGMPCRRNGRNRCGGEWRNLVYPSQR